MEPTATGLIVEEESVGRAAAERLKASIAKEEGTNMASRQADTRSDFGESERVGTEYNEPGRHDCTYDARDHSLSAHE